MSYFEKKGEDCKSEILEIQQKGSFELLVEALRNEVNYEPATGVLLRAIVGNGTDIEKLTNLKGLRPENYDWLLQGQFVQSTNSGGLSLVLAVDKVQPSDFKIFLQIYMPY